LLRVLSQNIAEKSAQCEFHPVQALFPDSMGGQSSKGSFDSKDREPGSKKKGGSFMSCTCGKGRDDKDEVQTAPGANGTRLTEEEWAAVKTGRLDAAKFTKPDLLSEGADESPSRGQHRKRITRNKESSEEGNGFGSPQPTAMNGADGARGREGGMGDKDRTTRVTSPSATRQEDSNGNHNPQELRFAVGDRVRCACSRW
jgi:hypothetical protein